MKRLGLRTTTTLTARRASGLPVRKYRPNITPCRTSRGVVRGPGARSHCARSHLTFASPGTNQLGCPSKQPWLRHQTLVWTAAPPHPPASTSPRPRISPRGGLVAIWVEWIGLRPRNSPGIKSGLHVVPAVDVVSVLQVLESKLGRPPDLIAFPHKRQSVLIPLRSRSVASHTGIKRVPVGTVRRELIVDTAGAGHEPDLCIIPTAHQAHEFRHDVAVVPRWSERVLGSNIPRGKHHEINVRSPRHRGVGRQHNADGRIRMVVRDGIDSHEIPHVILHRHEIPIPRDHVKRAVFDLATEQLPRELANHLMGLAAVLESRLGSEEVTGVGKTGADTDGPQVRDNELAAEVLQDVPFARGAAHAVHLEHHTSRHKSKLLLLHLQIPELRPHPYGPLLRHDNHVCVLVAQHTPALSHTGVESVYPCGGAVVCSSVPIHCHHGDTINKIHPCLLVHRPKAVLLWGEVQGCLVGKRRMGDWNILLRAVGHGRPHPILPRIPVRMPGDRERRS
mmetsp:Transcript_22959/g.56093  ORF Transcript_22959/g.56093 Transcript_22959/m.56093 type:complete len:507 (+) Transcript_22959:34-1554(+)